MNVISSRVVNGKIEIETDLRECTPVAILAAGDTGFELADDEEEELVTALNDIRRGNFEDGLELLRELKGLSGRCDSSSEFHLARASRYAPPQSGG